MLLLIVVGFDMVVFVTVVLCWLVGCSFTNQWLFVHKPVVVVGFDMVVIVTVVVGYLLLLLLLFVVKQQQL